MSVIASSLWLRPDWQLTASWYFIPPPEAWRRSTSPLVADLAPGRPLHADTWTHVLAAYGLSRTALHTGGEDRRLDRLATSNTDATTINAAIDTVNDLLLGPGEYLLVAVRDR